MPAWKLSDQPLPVRRYDVLATVRDIDDLPTHVMLCNEPADRHDVNQETELRIAHMGPPLVAKRGVKCQAVGSAELGDDQQRIIETFIRERFDEAKELRHRSHAAGQKWDARELYRIDPPVTRPSRDCSFWRYSCVGFVLAAYEDAGIHLLTPAMPLKDLEQIKQVYDDARLDDSAIREKMGLGSGTAWPVALAGYVVNAFDRPVEDIRGERSQPFQPVEGDEYFPSRRGSLPPNNSGGADKQSAKRPQSLFGAIWNFLLGFKRG